MAFDWPVGYLSVLSCVCLCRVEVIATFGWLLSAVSVFCGHDDVFVTFEWLGGGKKYSRLFLPQRMVLPSCLLVGCSCILRRAF